MYYNSDSNTALKIWGYVWWIVGQRTATRMVQCMLHIAGWVDVSLTDWNIAQTDPRSHINTQKQTLSLLFCVTFHGRHFVHSGTLPNTHHQLLSILCFTAVQFSKQKKKLIVLCNSVGSSKDWNLFYDKFFCLVEYSNVKDTFVFV